MVAAAVAAAFLVIVGLIVVPYYLLVVKEEQQFLGRLQPKAAASKVLKGVLLKEEERYSAVEPIDAALRRATGFTQPISKFLEQSGMRLTVSSFLLLTVTLPLAAFVLVNILTSLFVAALLAAVVTAPMPYLVVRRALSVRMLKFEEQFPEAIDLVARALRAGHALPTGLGMVADEMPKPVGTEFRKLYDEQNFGLTLPDALRNFAERIPILDARFFVTAVLTQREAGGNLAEVLDNLASVIRERFKVKRQVRVISAHGRITGWVLAGLPPSVALLAFVLSPSHIQTLLGDPLGVRMIIAAVIMQIVGTLIIRKIVDVEY